VSSLAVVVPALLDASASTLQEASARTPALRRLLAASRSTVSIDEGLWGWLCGRFGIARQQDWPLAPILAQSERIDVGSAYWMIADPETLEVGRVDVRHAMQRPELDATEAAALIATLNRHFLGDGVAFVSTRPDRWFVRVDLAAGAVSMSPDPLRGSPLKAPLQGSDTAQWRRWQTEIEMLLFEHPVNEAREARGGAPVNSLWCWGGGILPRSPAVTGTSVLTDAADVLALARFAGASTEPLGASALSAIDPTRRTIAIAPAELALQELETRFAAPAWRLLASGSCERIELVATGRARAVCWQCARPPWWRRMATIAATPTLDALVGRHLTTA
jgi:hypothetical protein